MNKELHLGIIKFHYRNYIRGFSYFKRAISIWIRLLRNEDINSLHPEMFKILFWRYLSGHITII